ncbi:methyl-accepting chemotaxis protein [Woodsholea maritima]|uniref:methyl-accepting chemotaxis protein n=1 Tax=Woodsholea maritima TaxID=240237 RepID=UPI0003725CE5|nr:methyl-accepting chemotaxis protein [Woodsholea maritima]
MSWSNLSIRWKIPALVVGFSALGMVAVAGAASFNAFNAVDHFTEDRLIGASEAKAGQLSQYLETLDHDVHSLSASPYVHEALAAFHQTYQAGQHSEALRLAYISDNQFPAGERHKLDQANTGLAYDQVHGQYHPWFRTHLELMGYYDLFLFNNNGDLVYSVFKEDDFATNFGQNGGRWAGTELGQIFRTAHDAPADTITFADFEPYAPSFGAAASFLAIPIYEKGERKGVLALQMPIGVLNALMHNTAGLGETGETVIVGEDGYLRSDSAHTDQDDVLQTRVDLALVEDAAKGRSAYFTDQQVSGRDVETAVSPVAFHDASWAVLAMQDKAEIVGPVQILMTSIVLACAVMIAVASLGGYIMSNGLATPMGRVVKALRAVAKGAKGDVLPQDEARKDEIGDLARSLKVFQRSLEDTKRFAYEREQRAEIEFERQREIEGLILGFRETVSTSLEAVGKELTMMRSCAEAVTQAGQDAGQSADHSKTASTSASKGVSAVDEAVQELVASFDEINRQTDTANSVVASTVQITRKTDNDVKQLAEAAGRIGEVIGLINDIAEQTNLLALNATIEAARAGEAGKGFAVVAQEVKALAEQTAKATGDISAQVEAVQNSTQGAVAALQEISHAIVKVEEISTVIAAAIEEQSAVTQSISGSITQAANGTRDAAGEVEKVTGAISSTRDRVEEMRMASDTVSEMNDNLRAQVDTFLKKVAENMDQRAA